MTRYNLLNAERQDDNDYILTVEHMPNWFYRLFGNKPREVRYLGSGTVWHELPYFRGCSSSIESILFDFYKMARHRDKSKLI